jgi:hypothetical protein
MTRIAQSILIGVVAVGFVPAASAAPPSTVPARTLAAPPSPEALHDAAIAAFRAGKRADASKLIDKAYDAASAERRARPLVLNRAIIDLTQRTFVMRAVRELSEYLRAHPEPDEQAHDVLGAALNIAADNPRWRQGPVWQSAYTEWARRDEQMTASRPGYRRWGPLWLTDAQFAAMESDKAEAQRAIDEQSRRVDEAQTRVESIRAREVALSQTLQDAFDQAQQIWETRQQINQQNVDYQRQMADYERRKAAYDNWLRSQPPKGAAGAPRAPHAPPVAPVIPAVPATPATPATPVAAGNAAGRTKTPIVIPNLNNVGYGSDFAEIPPGLFEERARLASDAALAQRDLRNEQTQLAKVKAQSNVRPPWPSTFEMVDPSELTPPPPAPPDPKAVERIVELTKRDAPPGAAAMVSPFAGSGQQKKRGGEAGADPNAALFPRRIGAPPIPPGAMATTAPAQPVTPAQVPFGPRSVDR